MKVVGYSIEKDGVKVELDEGCFFLQGISENIIRCRYTKEENCQESDPLLLDVVEGVQLQVAEDEQNLCFETAAIALNICREDGVFTWKNAVTGEVFLQEDGKQLVKKAVEKYSTNGEEPVIERVHTPDGERNFVKNLVKHTDRMAYRGKIFFRWQDDEILHGLGQGEEGIYNYRGANQYLYQHNMRIPVPFLVSDRNYGVFLNCGSLMTFNDDSRGSYLFMDTVEQIDYCVIYGKCLDDVVAGFRSLTGTAVMLPKWSFGYVQSKEAYRTQEELVAAAQEYRKREIPLDCIVQDWNTWEEGAWGNKLVDKKRFPDLKAALDTIHELNIHTMVSIWPNMNSGTENHTEFLENGYLLNDLATYDAFSEEARAMYWRQMNEELFSGGFDSWWCDSTEPFSGSDWGGEALREPWERYQLVGSEHQKYLDPAQANLYAVVHAKGVYENQRKTAPDKRVLNLTRSGYASSQRYGTVLWSGDTCATWENFRKQIAEGLNMCMSGMPYWTLDIGAFFTVRDKWQNRGCGCNDNPSPIWFWQGDYEDGVDDYGYRELYVRWFQYGTFLTMFRSHGTDTPREVWNFGKPGEPFYDALVKFIQLRYRLMPYIYSLAGKTWLEHYTMHRSLMFDFADDERAKAIGNQFMLGESIMVCPVTEPMYYEKNNRPIEQEKDWRCYLPKGSDWYDYWTGECFKGGQEITVTAEIDRIPVFIRAGAVIPMECGLSYASETVSTPFEIHVYPGADGEFHLYEDQGDDYQYEKGIFNYIRLFWNEQKQTLTVGSSRYDFNQSIRGRKCSLIVQGKKTDFVYTGETVEISL